VKSSLKAFDVSLWQPLAQPEHKVPSGALITLGFDGAMFHDSVALVGTEVSTGHQFKLGLWECPYGKKDWHAPVDDIEEAVLAAFDNYEVWRLYADPQYWLSYTAQWAGLFGKEKVIEWYTNRYNQMCYAIEAYDTAIKSGELSHDGNKDFERHMGNAFKKELNRHDEQGKKLWVIQKERGDSQNKIDLTMAAILSWKARLDAVALGVTGVSVYEERGPLIFDL
jgi:phage terminase large subunit-like protein